MKSNKEIIVMNSKMQNNAKQQQGVALIITLVVLLAMTIIGLTATDSSNLQSLLARNSQFRIEAFNASNTELNAQLDYYRSATFGTIDSTLNTLAAQPEGTSVVLGQNDADGNPFIVLRSVNISFTKDVTLTREGGCDPGADTTKECVLFRIDSSATYPNTNIRSDQVQTFSIIVLKG